MKFWHNHAHQRSVALLTVLVGGLFSCEANGQHDSSKYLSRRYDENTYLTTHNSMSNAADRWLFPNQTHTITRQLTDGARALMLDLHIVDGEVHLVHSKPFLGKRLLTDGLIEIRRFLEKTPKAVVTIIFESYATADAVKQSFDETELTKFVHSQQVNDPWPTLNQLISTGKRLVLFTDRGGGQWSGYHDVWAFCTETHFSVKSVDDFSFEFNRGKPTNRLFILNHFLTNPVASTSLARQANNSDLLHNRIETCHRQTKHLPTFVVVDFFEIGDTVKTVQQFNMKK